MAQKWVLVRYPVIAMFESETKLCRDQNESGGILIGSYRGPHVEISGFTSAAANDIRQPYRFIKQDERHQMAATRAWQASGGKDTYLGEWHTHPIGEPHPSTIDKRTWKGVVAHSNQMMVFAIVAPKGWQLFCCQRNWAWMWVRPLVAVEHGKTGVVFNIRSTTAALGQRLTSHGGSA